MGDLLIRNIDDDLKRRLGESAKRHGRSLSDEAILQIRKAMASNAKTNEKPGDRLLSLIGATFGDRELTAMDNFRKEADREPPSFD